MRGFGRRFITMRACMLAAALRAVTARRGTGTPTPGLIHAWLQAGHHAAVRRHAQQLCTVGAAAAAAGGGAEHAHAHPGLSPHASCCCRACLHEQPPRALHPCGAAPPHEPDAQHVHTRRHTHPRPQVDKCSSREALQAALAAPANAAPPGPAHSILQPLQHQQQQHQPSEGSLARALGGKLGTLSQQQGGPGAGRPGSNLRPMSRTGSSNNLGTAVLQLRVRAWWARHRRA